MNACMAGNMRKMSHRTFERPRRSLVPLTAVTAAAVVFTILLVLVRLQWSPLESADHGSAVRLNRLIASHSVMVTTVKAVTWLGSDGVLWTVIAAAVIVLALRRRWLLLIPAIAMPALVAISRVYRGEHHPTDILGSLLFSALWLTAASVLIKPNADGRSRTRPGTSVGDRREPARAAPVRGSAAR